MLFHNSFLCFYFGIEEELFQPYFFMWSIYSTSVARIKMDGMIGLEMGQLRLNEEEQETIVLRDEISEEGQIKEHRNLIGKFFYNKNLSKETIKGTMEKI